MNYEIFFIGFFYLFSLLFTSFIPVNMLLYVSSMFVCAFLICFLIKNFPSKKIILIYLSAFAVSSAVNFLNFTQNILPIKQLNEKEAKITAKIIDIPFKQNEKYNYTLNVKRINNKDVNSFKVKAFSSEPLEADIYTNFEGKVRFYLPKNTSGFNSELYYRSKGIYICAYINSFSEYKTYDEDNFNLSKEILNLRKKLLSFPNRFLNKEADAVINSFFLGEKHNLPENIKENFEKIGIYHLFATSGIHISIMSNFIFWILKKLRLNLKLSYLTTCVGIIIFMALAGFSPSIMRAGIMAIIYNVGNCFFRKANSLNSLGIAILIITLINPNSALDIGLWLSVITCLGIILIYPRIYTFMISKIKIQNKISKYFISIAAVSISASALSFILVVWFFKKWSTIFLVSNLIFIPLSTLTLNFTLIFEILALLNLPNVIIFPVSLVCQFFADCIINISHLLAKIPFAMISMDYGFVNLCLCFSLILIAISLLFKNYKKVLKISVLMSVVIHLIGFISYIFFNYNSVEISLINSSDGMVAILTKNFEKSAIICAGKNFNTTYLKNYFLKSQQQKFKYLILSSCENQTTDLVNKMVQKNLPEKILSDNSIKINEYKTINLKNGAENDILKDVKIKFFNIENFSFFVLNIYNKKFVFCMSGGNANLIPEDFKTCDFFILNRLPINYQNIKAKNTIICSNFKDSEIFINKLAKSATSLFSTAQNGNIYINLNTDNYSIRGSE